MEHMCDACGKSKGEFAEGRPNEVPISCSCGWQHHKGCLHKGATDAGSKDTVVRPIA
jgi:hypothetical protein